jgi:hypothetical protein
MQEVIQDMQAVAYIKNSIQLCILTTKYMPHGAQSDKLAFWHFKAFSTNGHTTLRQL